MNIEDVNIFKIQVLRITIVTYNVITIGVFREISSLGQEMSLNMAKNSF